MPRSAKKYPALGRQCACLEVRVGFELANVGDKKFDLFTAQGAAEFLPVVHLETGADFRVRTDKPRHRIWHQFHGRCRPGAKAQVTGVEFGHARHFTAQQGGAMHQAQGVLQHHLALGRGAQILVAAIDQHTAELLLQPLNAAAEGGLGDAHGVRSTHETAVFVEGDEVAQLAKIHMLSRHLKNRSKAFATEGAEVLNASSYSVNEALIDLLDLKCISIERCRKASPPSAGT